MPDGQPTPVTAPAAPPLKKCDKCGHEKEHNFSKPGTIGKAPAKGTKFRSATVTRGRGRPRTKARDYRHVDFY